MSHRPRRFVNGNVPEGPASLSFWGGFALGRGGEAAEIRRKIVLDEILYSIHERGRVRSYFSV